MINVYALLKYGMIFVLSSPEHFKWTALITLVSITAGGMSYMVFVGKSKRQGISL
jgi:hypothetical protein